MSVTVTSQHAASAPTGVRELTPPRVVSPVPENRRVSVVGSRTQIDIALPADARVADVLPYLSGLIAQRENGGQDPATLRGETTRRHVLRLDRDGAPLAPEQTLRAAGVRSGDLLYVDTERTLRPPTLHDDVVDAAAQLNRTAYAGWGPLSAAVTACAGLYAGVAILIWMSLDARFDAARAVLVGIDAAVVVALLSAAVAAHRFHGSQRLAAVFGWATIPLAAAAMWVPLSEWRPWGALALCIAVIVADYLAYRLIGGAVWGFLAGAVFASCAGVVAGARAVAGPDPVAATAVVATALVLASMVIPRVRAARAVVPAGAEPVPRTARDDVFADPFGTGRGDPAPDVRATLPTAETVLARARAAATVRSALYTGLSAALVLTLALLLRPPGPARGWADLAFAVAVAAALGLRARTTSSAVERIAPLAGAVAGVLVACAAALAGPTPFAVAGAVALLIVAAVAVLVALKWRPATATSRTDALLAYVDYLAVGMLIPLALAVIGLYDRLGGT